MGGIFKVGSAAPNCNTKNPLKGIMKVSFETTAGRSLTCGRNDWVTKLRYFPLDTAETTIAAEDNEYITNLPMESVASYQDVNVNAQVDYSVPSWQIQGAEELVKIGNCMWFDETASSGLNVANPYFLGLKNHACLAKVDLGDVNSV